jgi:hypothetical protein
MDDGPRTRPLARVAPALRAWWRSLAVSRGGLLSVYAKQFEEVGGRLFLSGVAPDLLVQFRRGGPADSSAIGVLPATELVGESSADAYRAAAEWRRMHAVKEAT